MKTDEVVEISMEELEKLEEELISMKTVLKEEILPKLNSNKANQTESHEYYEAKEKKDAISKRIEEIEVILKNAKEESYF